MTTGERPEDCALAVLTGVSRTYEGDVTALDQIDVTFHDATSCAVTGPSGSGKSTLLNILGLLDQPTAGRYLLAGRDMTMADDRARATVRRDLLGFVFQDFHLIPTRSVLENVMLGAYYTGWSRAVRAVRAEELIGVVGLTHRISAVANQLSGGERQRVAIARAMMCTPRLLLCDEPTGNLDSRNSDRVMEILLGLAREVTLVVVTHDPAVAARCDRTAEFRDGGIVHAGEVVGAGRP